MNRPLAVMTGASSGFGLLSSIELARKGFFVVATLRDLGRREPLERAVAQAGLSESVTLARLDVTEFAAHEEFVRSTLATYGRIDVLVNNAGFAVGGFGEDVTLDELRHQFETNFFGAVSLSRAVLPTMRRQGSGRIIMLSSISGRSGFPAMSSYAASKFALEGYSESLRLEMAPLGIQFVLVEPGSYETAIWYRKEEAAAAAFSPDSPNYPRAMKLRKKLLDAKGRRDPIEVARVIAHAATVSRPKMRYVVGPDARMVVALRALLPWSLFERMVARVIQAG